MVSRKNGKNIIVVGMLVFLLSTLHSVAWALGEYDGVWIGTETITVPNYGVFAETTGTVVYQSTATTLHLWDPLFGSVGLVWSGSQWTLPSPIWTTYLGYPAQITSVTISFPNTNSMVGTITAGVLGVTASATLSHSKQSCQTLSNGGTLSGISGAEGSVRCYQIDLPQGSTNFNVQTWGGTGDCDLLQVYHRPDFNFSESINGGNTEQLSEASPGSGLWYIALIGETSYSGLNLQATFTVPVPSPVANFAADLFTGDEPLTVSYSDQSTGSITSWAWDFGDGTTASEQNPVHLYSDPGLYTVSLTVSGPGGTDSEIKSDYILVNLTVKPMPWMFLLLKDNN